MDYWVGEGDWIKHETLISKHRQKEIFSCLSWKGAQNRKWDEIIAVWLVLLKSQKKRNFPRVISANFTKTVPLYCLTPRGLLNYTQISILLAASFTELCTYRRKRYRWKKTFLTIFEKKFSSFHVACIKDLKDVSSAISGEKYLQSHSICMSLLLDGESRPLTLTENLLSPFLFPQNIYLLATAFERLSS